MERLEEVVKDLFAAGGKFREPAGPYFQNRKSMCRLGLGWHRFPDLPGRLLDESRMAFCRRLP